MTTLPISVVEEDSDDRASSTVCACTIIARNYLPAARVLHRSFREQHPSGWFIVLVIDDVYAEVDDEGFEVWRPTDLDLPPGEFHRMAAMYDLMSLATAVKPWLLRKILLSGCETVIYLDPDIRLFAPLDEVVALARKYEIVLTPHATEPMPRDGLQVTETTILSSGVYNLGFIALSDESHPFLDFWSERLRRECYIDHANHRFVDQRWIDFVPGMFECHILRDPRFNVAYWNLDHRQLVRDGDGYFVEGRPLGFFHFSGFNPQIPYLLSKHQGTRPRILLSENPAVAELCSDYVNALRREGYGLSPGPTYPFDVLPNGVRLDERLRSAYREWASEREAAGDEPPSDPFTLEGSEAFVSYLTTPAPGCRVPRYVLREWRKRLDLQLAFPKPEGADRERILEWAEHEAVHFGRLDPLLVARETPTRWAAPVEDVEPGPLSPGIRVAGYLRAEAGTGEMGRLALAAVRQAGLESGTFVYGNTLSRQNHPLHEDPRTDLNINLIAVNADQIPIFADDVGEDFLDRRYNIGFWAWELETFPEAFERAFDYVDEVWTLSEFARQSIARVTDKPVLKIPLPVLPASPPEDIDRNALGLPGNFIFLFCFDQLSVMERKNPLGVIEAFRRAFRPGEGPLLVIKALNGDRMVVDQERLRFAASDRPDIVILDQYLSNDENAALIRACDCYVSLHRSEGFGLTMTEAMAFAKPVIATAYSGNLDFMNMDNSYLVPWTAAEAPPGIEPYPEGARWAEPDLDVAAQLMRRVVERPEEAAAVGRRARDSVRELNGFEPAVEFVKQRFDAIQVVLGGGRLAAPASSAPQLGPPQETVEAGSPPENAEGVSPAGELTALAGSGPALDAASAHPRMASVVRRTVRRAVVHQELHRRKVEVALASAIEGLQATVSELGKRVEATDEVDSLLESRLRTLEDRLGAFETRLGKLDSHVARIAARIQSRRVSTRRDLHEMEQRLTEIEKGLN